MHTNAPRSSTNGQFLRSLTPGDRHARVVALRATGAKATDGSYLWVMRCDCGTEFTRSSSKFRQVLSCGCARAHNAGQYSARNHRGAVVNDVVLLEPTADRDVGGYVIWRCQCRLCGDEFTRPATAVARGTLAHLCPAYWAKYGRVRNGGRQALPNHAAHVNILYGHYRQSAKVRAIAFQLTKDEARSFFERPCHYCGVAPAASYTSKNLQGTYAWNGIDRRDPAGPYSTANCVPACKTCNWAKGSMTDTAFYVWVCRVAAHVPASPVAHGVAPLKLFGR